MFPRETVVLEQEAGARVTNPMAFSQLNAKSVLERDLAALQAKRAERERAAGVLRLRAASQEPTATLNDRVTFNQADKAKNSDETVGGTAPATENADTREGILKGDNENPGPNITIAKDLLGNSLEASPAVLPQPSQPFDSTDSILSNPERPKSPNPDDTQIPENGQVTTHSSDGDFDSMFTDTAPHDSTSLDFDLNFSNATDGNIALAENPFGDITTTTDFTNTSNEDINSLLPGLESYVNDDVGAGGSDDFSTADLPPITATIPTAEAPPTTGAVNLQDIRFDLTESETAAGARLGADDSLMEMDPGPVESTFDDMFNMGLGDGMGEDDYVGELGDFDAAWGSGK